MSLRGTKENQLGEEGEQSTKDSIREDTVVTAHCLLGIDLQVLIIISISILGKSMSFLLPAFFIVAKGSVPESRGWMDVTCDSIPTFSLSVEE